MHRFFGFMALTAVGLGCYLLLAGPSPEPAGSAAQTLQGAPIAYSGWAVGLIMGLTLAWLAGLDWSNLPERIAQWVKLQRRRVGWIMLGGVFASILLLF